MNRPKREIIITDDAWSFQVDQCKCKVVTKGKGSYEFSTNYKFGYLGRRRRRD